MGEAFQVVILGCTGGPKEGNLSGYIVSPATHNEWIALDAGTLLSGIDRAIEKNSLSTVNFTDPVLSQAGEMFVKHIRGYLISHAHLDHIAGLVLNSQVDDHKFVAGIDSTIDNIRDHIFNGRIWPNYGSEGLEPVLRRYHYVRLPLHEKIQVPNTSMNVEAYLLSHPRGYPSSAFLLEHKEDYLLYFGDTSSDYLEVEKHLTRVWNRIAPLLQQKKLRGMLLECSFSQYEADQAIFGHLDTKLMLKELVSLSNIADVSLEGFRIVVTHRKESIKAGPDTKEVIAEELRSLNHLGVDFVFPTQGDRILF